MSVDAFPNDANASLDTDGDGQPDDWNPGYDGTGSSLTVDDDDDNDGVPDESDDLPKDPSDSVDTDGDGVGPTDADDGDDFNDQTEISAGTDPLDAAEYPYSGGRVGLVYLSDYGDRNRDFVEVLVARHGSSQGEVSIDYTTVAGGAARPGEHFEMVSGTLTWADGDQATKTVQVPLVGEPGGTNAQFDFGVLLENLVGNAKYDATAGRVVLHDDLINPDWSGNLLTPYRTVVSKDGEAFLRVDRVGGSKGSLSATIGSNGQGCSVPIMRRLLRRLCLGQMARLVPSTCRLRSILTTWSRAAIVATKRCHCMWFALNPLMAQRSGGVRLGMRSLIRSKMVLIPKYYCSSRKTWIVMPPMIARVLSSMPATITGRTTTQTQSGGSIG